MNQSQTSAPYWLGRLSGHLHQFQAAPSSDTKTKLLIALGEYQKVVSDGLEVPRTVPPPLRNAKTYSDWYRKIIDEAMAMYQINPSESRLNILKEHLNGYQDAVRMGRVCS